jgi:hypothetical protein
MKKYCVRLNYDASIEVEVLANDEGDALGQAREYAETEADIKQFSICNERNAQIISAGD